MGFVSGLWNASGQNDTTAANSNFVASGATGLPQSDYAGAIAQSQRNAMATGDRQSSLTGLLEQQSRGEGPSVAQEMLRKQADANAQRYAGALAAQRGLNPGLANRNIMQQRAAGDQAMAGDAALLRAQEMLGARSLLAQQLAAQRGQDIGLMQGAGGLQNQQSGLAIQNALGAQQINAGTANANAQRTTQARMQNAQIAAGGAQDAGNSLQALGTGLATGGVSGLFGGGGGSALPEPGEAGLAPSWGTGVYGMASGGQVGYAKAIMDMRTGGKVPGRAAVPGDDRRNDRVPIMASPGEVVLPRSVTMAPDAPDRAARFLKALQAKKGVGGGDVKRSFAGALKKASGVK